MTLPEPRAQFDLQEHKFHWTVPTVIDVPITVAVPPLSLYTESQMRQQWNDALDAAADKCRRLNQGWTSDDHDECICEILNLKEPT